MATASPGNFDEVLRAAQVRVNRCPTARARLRATVTRACEASVEPEVRHEIPRWGLSTLLGGLLVLAVVVLVAVSGCVPMEAVEQAREEHAINVGHALDESLPLEARLIAADAVLAWEAQAVALTGDHLQTPQAVADLAAVVTESR